MNKRLTIGMITIGQSPRNDLVHEIMNLARIDAEVLECGVLDGLSLSEIKKLVPEPSEYVLVTKLSDGTPTRLAHSKIIEKVQSCIDSLINQGIDFLVILCSGDWPKFKSTKLVITPGDTFRSFTIGMVNEGDKLGIIVPDEDQVVVVEKKWHREKIQLRIAVASPFGSTANNEMVRAARSLKESGVDLVAMDCIGYTVEKKRIVQEITGKPVVLVRSVLASIIREIAS
jgi:protein AroM